MVDRAHMDGENGGWIEVIKPQIFGRNSTGRMRISLFAYMEVICKSIGLYVWVWV